MTATLLFEASQIRPGIVLLNAGQVTVINSRAIFYTCDVRVLCKRGVSVKPGLGLVLRHWQTVYTQIRRFRHVCHGLFILPLCDIRGYVLCLWLFYHVLKTSVIAVCCIFLQTFQTYFLHTVFRQTVWTQIRLLLEEQSDLTVWTQIRLLKEQSDLGPYCLQQ